MADIHFNYSSTPASPKPPINLSPITTFQHSLVFLSRVMGFLTLLFSLLLLQDGSQGQLLEVESVVAHDDHNEQHRLERGLTTYQCQGWSDIPTTIYLTSPHSPIGVVQQFSFTVIIYFNFFRNCVIWLSTQLWVFTHQMQFWSEVPAWVKDQDDSRGCHPGGGLCWQQAHHPGWLPGRSQLQPPVSWAVSILRPVLHPWQHQANHLWWNCLPPVSEN